MPEGGPHIKFGFFHPNGKDVILPAHIFLPFCRDTHLYLFLSIFFISLQSSLRKIFATFVPMQNSDLHWVNETGVFLWYTECPVSVYKYSLIHPNTIEQFTALALNCSNIPDSRILGKEVKAQRYPMV